MAVSCMRNASGHNDLKSKSVEAHKIWMSAGRPRSGPVFNIMKSAKSRYKLAIKDAVHVFENKFSDELYECLLSKDVNNFLENLET